MKFISIFFNFNNWRSSQFVKEIQLYSMERDSLGFNTGRLSGRDGMQCSNFTKETKEEL